jgi:hypothetical protein
MIIEDGSGLEDADSYASIAKADDYHQARGNDYWIAASAANKEAALVRACDYIEQGYSRLWHGARTTSRQRLSFPRYGIEDLRYDEIPRWIIEAQCEAALLEIKQQGCLSESWSEGGSLESEKEGEVARNYREGQETVRKYPSIYKTLAHYISNPSRIEARR